MKIYEAPAFKVECDGQTSDWYRQEVGIRQGCPLSPYLFIVVMTAMFHDIDREEIGNRVSKRVINTNFDEVLYADDTICISTDTRVINRRLSHIEKHGARYGLLLNKDKCEVLSNAHADIHFADGTRIKHKQEVRYLGCMLNMRADTTQEIRGRISTCMAIMKKLDLYWLHARCPVKWKVLVLDAVIRSKLLYGLETATLSDASQRKINAFQLKGLRKILGMHTTFINRDNTNERVFENCNNAIKAFCLWRGSKAKQIERFSAAYKKSRGLACARILSKRSSDPMKYTTLDTGGNIWDFPGKRVGRPKNKWMAEGVKDMWDQLRSSCEETPNRNLLFNTAKTNTETNRTIIATMTDTVRDEPGKLRTLIKQARQQC